MWMSRCSICADCMVCAMQTTKRSYHIPLPHRTCTIDRTYMLASRISWCACILKWLEPIPGSHNNIKYNSMFVHIICTKSFKYIRCILEFIYFERSEIHWMEIKCELLKPIGVSNSIEAQELMIEQSIQYLINMLNHLMWSCRIEYSSAAEFNIYCGSHRHELIFYSTEITEVFRMILWLNSDLT